MNLAKVRERVERALAWTKEQDTCCDREVAVELAWVLFMLKGLEMERAEVGADASPEELRRAMVAAKQQRYEGRVGERALADLCIAIGDIVLAGGDNELPSGSG